MNPFDTMITSITPDKPKDIDQPVKGKDFKDILFKRPPPFAINVAISKDNKKAKLSEVYKVKARFAMSTVRKVMIYLKNNNGGLVPDPGPVVSNFKHRTGGNRRRFFFLQNLT